MKYYGYTRVSTASQSEHGFGLETQKNSIIQYAECHGLTIEHIFTDDGISGATGDDTMDLNRQGMNELFSVLSNDDKIIVLNTSRLWRDDTSKVLIRHELKKVNADVISIEQPNYSIYSKNPDDFFINAIQEILDQYDKLLITRKLANGRRTKASQGKKACGVCPFSYRYDSNKNVVIDYNNHLIVQDIFRMYSGCRNLSEVARLCSEKGYKTNNGNDFSKQAISNMLHNDFYCGIVTHAGKKVQGTHEPIITQELFDKVNQ